MSEKHLKIAQIIDLPVETTIRCDVEKVLKSVKKMEYDDIIVVGLKNGKPSFQSTESDVGNMLMWIEKAKQVLLNFVPDGSEDE